MRHKHPKNPVIAGSSRDPTQSYPPTVVKVNGTYFCITKTEANDLVGFVSEDGINWEEETKHVLKRSICGWDQRKVSSPLLRYDPARSRYHLYYAGHLPDGKIAIGYAISEKPLSGYWKIPKNPICAPVDISDELEREYNRVVVSDLIRMSDEFLFYGTARTPEDDSIIWIAKGGEWTKINNFEVLLDQSELDYGSLLQTPTITKINNTYVLQFTAGENAAVLNERRLYLAVGETPYDFNVVADPLLETGTEGSWDERRVYGAQWLKKQDGHYVQPELVDGRIRLYYSGHDLGHHVAPEWKKKLHHPSIGSYYNLENQSIARIIARYYLTKIRRYGSVVFDYNRGYTGVAEYSSEELSGF